MAKVIDTNVLIQQLGHLLADKRSSAAKRLRKQGNVEAGSAIFVALKKELKDRRTWNSQWEMLLALGELRYYEALPYLWELTALETPNTILYSGLGDAIVRLSSRTVIDYRPVPFSSSLAIVC